MTVPGGRVAMGDRDPVSCTTFNHIRVPRILETKNSRIALLFLAILMGHSLLFLLLSPVMV